MRQQLISWLIEDIAPEVRRTKDAATTIVKFAREHNLPAAQVQALGQLFNTAKTLSFLEKSAARRGDNFPILDVDSLVDKFMDVEKSASMTSKPRFEFDDQDNGCGLELPACFSGLTHNVLRQETPAPAIIYDNPVKQAAAQREQEAVTREFAAQAKFEYVEEMRKAAGELAVKLRENPDYPFSELEADCLGLFGDTVRPLMDKLAAYCLADGWEVKRATAPSDDKLVEDPRGMVPLVESLLDNVYRIKAADEMLSPSGDVTQLNPPLSSNKVVDSNGAEIELKTPKSASATAQETIDPVKKQEEINQRGGATQDRPSAGHGEEQPPPKTEGSGQPPRGPGSQTTTPGESGGGGGGKGKGDKPMTFFADRNKELDSLVSSVVGLGSKTMKSMASGWNEDQQVVDKGLQDARHIAVLQNLLTTDEILADADPEQVVNLYNTIRESAPQLAGDANVMRVLLRSAVQHDGISTFDLKAVLDTELSKQKANQGQQQIDDSRYSIKLPAGGKGNGSDKDK
jgi:hypothetical protein